MGNRQEREGDGGGLGVVDWIGLAGTGTVDHLVSFRLVSWIPNGRLTPFTGPAGGDDLIKALMCVWVRPNLAFPNSSEREDDQLKLGAMSIIVTPNGQGDSRSSCLPRLRLH